MRRSVLILFVLVVVVFHVPASLSVASSREDAGPTNLVVNGDFEAGTSESEVVPFAWGHESDAPATFGWESAEVHSGAKSVKISSTSANDARWLQTVAVQPNTTYVLSGWIKTDNVAHTQGSEDAGANLSLFGTPFHTAALIGTQAWTYVSLQFNSGPNQAIRVAARLGYTAGATSGTAWFDDIELAVLPLGPNGDPANMVSNGDFETGPAVAGGSPSAWTPDLFDPFSEAATLSWDDSEAYSGTKSVKISITNANDGRWLQTVAVRPYTTYLLSGWIKTDHVAHTTQPVDSGASLGIFGYWTHSAALFGSNDWTYTSYVFNSGPDHTLTIAARLGFWSGTTTGTAWFDDIQLVPTLAPQMLAVADTLALNGGFEAGAAGSASLPAAWQPESYVPATFGWESAEVHSGARSVKISSTSPNDARWLQMVAVQPYTTYRLSGWIKTDNVAHTQESEDAGANLSVFGTWTHSAALIGTHDWTYVSLEFNTGATDTLTIAARLGFWSGTTSGTAWFDDIQLIPASMLVNGSFESGATAPDAEPDAWTRSSSDPASATLVWENSIAHSGTKSVKISASSPNDVRWLQTVAVQPNTTYMLTGWIKTDNVAHTQESEDAGANLSIYGTWMRSRALFGSNDWTYVSYTFNSGSAVQVTIAARLGFWLGTTTGTAWFDDIQLLPVLSSG